MPRFSRFFPLILLIVVFTLTPAQTTHAATFTAGTAAELIAAITTANGNGEADVITLTANITLTAIDNALDGANGLPSILADGGNSLAIEGAGFTIQRLWAGCTGTLAQDFRIFHVSAGGDLSLDNVTIQNGCANAAFPGSSGGGVYNLGTVTITNSTLSGNSATNEGGGIFNWGGTVTISNSTLSGNSSTTFGGGIWNAGTATISNSTLSGNSATNWGGGVYNEGTVTISNSTLSGNSATSYGGGIYNEGTATINNSTLEGNSARFGGGVFNWTVGTATITNSTLSGNSSNWSGGGVCNFGTLNIDNSTLSGNSSNWSGGGIFGGGTVSISNSTFDDNSATDGGGVYISSTATISNSTFDGNSATNDGGGVYNDGTVNIDNSTLTGNSATNDGGGVYNEFRTVSISNSTLSGNSANFGGGVYNDGTVTIDNSTLTGNSATNEGGGIWSRVTVNITHATLSGNSAATGGGIINNGGWVNLTASIIANSTGGGDCVNVGTIAINVNNLIEDNSCTPAFSGDPNLGGLADNGGATQTHELQVGSPAIDGTGAACPVVGNLDQRGAARDAFCDIGAYEAFAPLTSLSFDVDFSTIYEDGVAGPTVATVTVMLDNPLNAPAGVVTVYMTITGTASEGGSISFDYQQGGTAIPLIFNGGNWPTPGNPQTLTFTFTTWDDTLVENPETINMLMDFTGPAEIDGTDTRTVTIISDEAPPPPAAAAAEEDDDGEAPNIGIFDPGLSKIGVLMPGELGILGERIEWVTTVTNNGSSAGHNIVITDTLRDELRIDSVSTTAGTYTIVGQTVTVTIPVLNPGESVIIRIVTTVLESDITVDNTACLMTNDFDNGNPLCVTTDPVQGVTVRELPRTGETPLWAQWMQRFGIFGRAATLLILRPYGF